jgi:hypothetical protein
MDRVFIDYLAGKGLLGVPAPSSPIVGFEHLHVLLLLFVPLPNKIIIYLTFIFNTIILLTIPTANHPALLLSHEGRTGSAGSCACEKVRVSAHGYSSFTSLRP